MMVKVQCKGQEMNMERQVDNVYPVQKFKELDLFNSLGDMILILNSCPIIGAPYFCPLHVDIDLDLDLDLDLDVDLDTDEI